MKIVDRIKIDYIKRKSLIKKNIQNKENKKLYIQSLFTEVKEIYKRNKNKKKADVKDKVRYKEIRMELIKLKGI